MIVQEIAPDSFVVFPGYGRVMRDGQEITLSSVAGWSDAELGAFGLYRPIAFIAPAGKRAVGGPRFQRIDGLVHEIRDVEDIPPPPVPAEVTPRQIRLALNQVGLRSQVEAFVGQADQDTRDAWEYSVDVERQHPFVLAAAQALDKTEQEIDDLFRLAASL